MGQFKFRNALIGRRWSAAPICTLVAGLLWLACSTAGPLPPPEWYSSPPPCKTCYTGLGDGASPADAKRKALGALCDAIKTTVTSDFVSEEMHHLRTSMKEGLTNAEVDYEQAVGLMVTTSSRCTFEGVPYRADPVPARVGDRFYVRLVLAASDYARFLASRRTGFRLDSGGEEMSADTKTSLLTAAARCMTVQGYLPATAQTDQRPYLFEITMHPVVSDSGVENLLGANTAPAMRLIHAKSGRIEWQVSLPRIKAMGFDRETVLRRLGENVVKKIEEKCNSLP